jgi:hypothetical protein
MDMFCITYEGMALLLKGPFYKWKYTNFVEKNSNYARWDNIVLASGKAPQTKRQTGSFSSVDIHVWFRWDVERHFVTLQCCTISIYNNCLLNLYFFMYKQQK